MTIKMATYTRMAMLGLDVSFALLSEYAIRGIHTKHAALPKTNTITLPERVFI